MAEYVVKQGDTAVVVLLDEAGGELRFRQEQDSVLKVYVIRLNKRGHDTATADDIFVEQEGEHCQTEICALNYLCGNSTASLHTHVFHNKGKGSSRQIVKFILDENAKGEFYGELKIAQDAQQTDAQQTNRNLLLSGKADMRTRPQLEIYADDVKASHGASTGQLDESALFYMQQRGISPEEGRKMLIRAFMSDIIDSVPDKQKREMSVLAADSIFN